MRETLKAGTEGCGVNTFRDGVAKWTVESRSKTGSEGTGEEWRGNDTR